MYRTLLGVSTDELGHFNGEKFVRCEYDVLYILYN